MSQDPFRGKYGTFEKITAVQNKEYIYTERSFTKRELLQYADGRGPWWKWGPSRLNNEYSVLEYLRQHTTIPVPAPFETGYDAQGRYFVTMERIYGVPLNQIGKECRVPKDSQHVSSGPCFACADMAYYNADVFITHTVIPQLSALTSTTTGFNGFALPPPRILEYDNSRDSWPTRTSATHEYCLVHGDLAAHNVMMDPRTLQVACIFDWETAGYYPPGMEAETWRMKGMGYYDLFEDTERILREIKLIMP